ncbi:hypothetical protein [Streptantibioticus ferralitis]|uniref:Uncharacterized protein n=1 Tax=Streptantibioticus ferralitis TaxID=236510 RepID=A0ABT5YYQ9_9ACTN|nr:hypothetical protein [Streptantibioticus ferralitis]MDF2256623.1 hypothetical protein [Streptantibioticus ferralitis]
MTVDLWRSRRRSGTACQTGATLVGSLLGPRGRTRLTMPVAVRAMLLAPGHACPPSLGWALACQTLTG